MEQATANVAVIGCGKRGSGKVGWAIGHAHAEGWLQCGHPVRLYGVDVSPDNLAAFGERFSLPKEQLFASTDALYEAVKPDFVSVCTWPALHAPMVIEAAARGARGIVCEKPLGLDGGEVRQMLAACRKAGTRLAVGHQRRYDPRFQLARRLLHEGAIGGQWCLEGRVGDDWDILSWTVHWFDMANFLFDAAPQSILAGVDHRGERRYGHAVERASVIFADYPGDRQAVFITGPRAIPPGEITIRGESGMMHVGKDVRVWNTDGFHVHTPEKVQFSAPFAPLMAEVIAAAGSDRSILCDASQCAIATEMAFAAHESARTMRRITLPLSVDYAPLEVAQHPPRPHFPARQVALLADGHFGSGGREGLAEALEALSGRPPRVIDAAAGLSESDVDGAELLALYHTHKDADERTRSILRRWVEAGRPLLLVHAALGAYPTWDEYLHWAGRCWVWDGPERSRHPHEPSELRVASPERFRTGWTTAWLPRDEVFIELGARSEVVDLLSVTISSGTYPAAWINAHHRNVGVFVPGHRRDLWGLEVLRQGLAAVACAIVDG